MTVRFASFNVENLFARPKALNVLDWADGRPILEAYGEFNSLIQLADYTPTIKARMIELLLRVEVYRNDSGIIRRNRVTDPKWAWLRANRGAFDVEHEATGIEIVANNRSDWIGWLELAKETINETTVEMTARVIQDLKADVLGVVEAENRPALDMFSEERLLDPYDHVMLIDGNDTRGIDVGIMTTSQIEIVNMRSNVDEPDSVATGEHLFSRDCAEYQLRLASGASVWVLMNHFKSQSGGGGDKRRRQAKGVRDIVDSLVADGESNIIVMGDLNEGPDADAPTQPAINLAPLYGPGSPLVEAYSIPGFNVGNRPGSFQNCSITNRLDYIFVSQALVGLVTGGGLERHGLWGTPTNKNPPPASFWEIYGDLQRAEDAASDHAAIYADINI
jgi:endonuclease/exonuclease/phosphatase family metal-dependent hydrolase